MIQEQDVLPRATGPPFLSALDAKNDTTNPFGYKLGEFSWRENNKAILFFSGKDSKQFELLAVPFKPLCRYKFSTLVSVHYFKELADIKNLITEQSISPLGVIFIYFHNLFS